MTQDGKEKKCGWGRMYHSCSRKAVMEMESLTGKWTPICSYHLKIKERNNLNNPWGALFPIKTRNLSERQYTEHDLELIKEGYQRSDRDTRRGE